MSATFDPETYAREQERINRTHPQPNGAADHGPVRKLDIVWADSIEIDLSRSGLVDGLLDRSGLTVLYGPSGSGKTFVALDLACHVAAGRAWRSHMVAPGVVVYCAAESPTSVERRTWAWKRHHGVEHLPLVIVRSSLDLLNGDTDAVLALLAGIGREHGRVALVVVDTLARAMVGNENSPEDMGKFVGSCGRIKEAADTHVLVVHHAGKDEARGARGHSCLRAATDTELEVTKGGETGSIRVTKSREAEAGLERFSPQLAGRT